MRDFVHLHLHTQCSLLDGAAKIPEVISRVKALGQKAVAITDHGVMYGVVDFYNEAKKNGIKPIIGCEVYTAARGMTDKTYELDSVCGHLVLLAENNTGYKNLVKLVSRAQIDGFYYKPRVDFELLAKHSEGLIALSACMAGDIPRALLSGNNKKAEAAAARYIEIFGKNNFFIEIQNQGIDVQPALNAALVNLANRFGLGVVATNDAHYVEKSDAEIQDILMCIQMGKKLSDKDRMRFATNEFYIKSYDEMKAALKGYEFALETTAEIAERCNVEFDFTKTYLPEFDTGSNMDSFTYLKNLCLSGMDLKYGTRTPAFIERLEHELCTIKQMGFVDYFLIVWDFVKFAKENGIAVGPGRGSAAGSIVSYLLNITTVDPIKYNLLFERFLNPERVTMPDIDIDFCYERRSEVIDYVVKKYGADRVTQIITFGTLAAKAAIRDIGRVMDVPIPEVDRISKMIPKGINVTLASALEESEGLKKAYDTEGVTRRLIDNAMAIEGMFRNPSIHAAGVVIYKTAADNYLPIQRQGDVITTQFTKDTVERLGLLKMDFLGLRNLTIIRDTVEIIKISHGVDVDIENIDLNSPDIYAILQEGDTDGVFQLESEGMRRFLRELKPDCFEDVIAAISLYRPGPMASIPTYIHNKRFPGDVKYKHPRLEKILEPTYGCIVYQEQVMQIVRELAGYSLGRADIVRRAMAKKKEDVLKQERALFVFGGEGIEGCVNRGVSENCANEIFDEIMDFAKYAFNKSHAAAYAVIACRTAWLKANYPAEFMASLMTAFLDNSSKVSRYIDDCRKKKIRLLPPDINKSYGVFTTEDGDIRFGLAAIKNVGRTMVDRIVDERGEGAYSGLYDFINRTAGTEVNKRGVEALIKCGAFDSLGEKRSRLIVVYEDWMDNVQAGRRNRVEGQLSLFGFDEDDAELPQVAEFTPSELLEMEYEYSGLYLSGHPLDEYRLSVKINSDASIGELSSEECKLADGDFVSVAGILTRVKVNSTKSGFKMAFADISDFDGKMGLVFPPKTYEKFSYELKTGNKVTVKGKLSVGDEKVEISVFDVKKLNKISYEKDIRIVIRTDTAGLKAAIPLFSEFYGGDTEVYIFNEDDGKWRALKGEKAIFFTGNLKEKLKNRYGSGFEATKI